MRVLTVRQPWAWAIIHGGKDVENRSRNLAGDHRGPVAIHAGLAEPALGDPRRVATLALQKRRMDALSFGAGKVRGSIIGVVDLVDVHTSDDIGRMAHLRGEWPTCSRWAERTGYHLVLANPRPLTEPIPFKGGLGLRKLNPDTIALIEGALS